VGRHEQPAAHATPSQVPLSVDVNVGDGENDGGGGARGAPGMQQTARMGHSFVLSS
jgi:hypothetical protein